jgi:tRNA modification GTPase
MIAPSSRAPLVGEEDTIAAVATAPGRGALAVLRLSGKSARIVAKRVLPSWDPVDRQPALVELWDPATGDQIDRVMATFFQAPRSYTGDDLVEITVHGGVLVPALALHALLAAGAREALPGEFTRRAVVAGKMDVLQAEGVADLVDAQSRAMHRTALRQVDGALSRQVEALRNSVLDVEALIAYDIDFPEEDEGSLAGARVLDACDRVLGLLDHLLATARTGELIRHGATVVIAGAPNAGKSSLFNALVGSTRAIVTDIPGTTRDAIEAVIDLGNWPVRLVDTAGLRETDHVVERLGIEVSERYLAQADVVLAVGESQLDVAATVARVRALGNAPTIAVWAKADLVANSDDMQADLAVADEQNAHLVSVYDGRGLAALAAGIARELDRSYGLHAPETPLLTRERHREAIVRARDEVAAFKRGWEDQELPAPVVAVHLRMAVLALEELIGAIDVEDVLDRVFRSFCVGK